MNIAVVQWQTMRPNYYLEDSLRIQLYIRVLLVVNFCQSRIVQN